MQRFKNVLLNSARKIGLLRSTNILSNEDHVEVKWRLDELTKESLRLTLTVGGKVSGILQLDVSPTELPKLEKTPQLISPLHLPGHLRWGDEEM
jgi:hypothetical protein